MSENPNFSDYHRQGEQGVKSTIRNGDGEYQHVGREQDPRVAEAMAYAAKPLIDNAVQTMNENEANGLAVTAEGHLTSAPGVVTEDYLGRKSTTSYKELEERVRQGHRAADAVQTDYYDKVTTARKAVKDAEQAFHEAESGV